MQKRRSSYNETPILLYRKGKLPYKLKNKKPKKSSLLSYNKKVLVETTLGKAPKEPFADTPQDNNRKESKFNFLTRLEANNNDLGVVEKIEESLDSSPMEKPSVMNQNKPVEKIRAVVISKSGKKSNINIQ